MERIVLVVAVENNRGLAAFNSDEAALAPPRLIIVMQIGKQVIQEYSKIAEKSFFFFR